MWRGKNPRLFHAVRFGRRPAALRAPAPPDAAPVSRSGRGRPRSVRASGAGRWPTLCLMRDTVPRSHKKKPKTIWR